MRKIDSIGESAKELSAKQKHQQKNTRKAEKNIKMKSLRREQRKFLLLFSERKKSVSS